MSRIDISPGNNLNRKVRIGFINQGTTLSAWCRSHHINPANARSALLGAWDGKKGKDIRARLIKASGLASLTSLAA